MQTETTHMAGPSTPGKAGLTAAIDELIHLVDAVLQSVPSEEGCRQSQ